MLNFLESCFGFVEHQFVRQWDGLQFFGIYAAAMIFFLTQKKYITKCFSVYTIFLFATVFNPIPAKIVFSYFDMEIVYYRFFWLLPINIILAYAFIQLIHNSSGKVLKAAVLALSVFAIIILGEPIFDGDDFFTPPENLYKVSDEVLVISDYIHLDNEKETPRVAPHSDLLMVLRQYDASLQLTLSRDLVLCWQGADMFQSAQSHPYYTYQDSIMDVLYAGDTSNPGAFLFALEKTQTEYLVYSKGVDIQDFLDEMNMIYVGDTANYVIYKVPEKE